MMLKLKIAIAAAVVWSVPASAFAADYQHLMPSPAYVWVHHTMNPACGGSPCADPFTGEVWIGKNPDRFTVSHEIGHVWWEHEADKTDREWFSRKMRLGDAPWYGSRVDYDNWHTIAGELAADAYATCDLGMRPEGRRQPDGTVVGEWFDAYGYEPTSRQQRQVCRRIRAIGSR